MNSQGTMGLLRHQTSHESTAAKVAILGEESWNLMMMKVMLIAISTFYEQATQREYFRIAGYQQLPTLMQQLKLSVKGAPTTTNKSHRTARRKGQIMQIIDKPESGSFASFFAGFSWLMSALYKGLTT